MNKLILIALFIVTIASSQTSKKTTENNYRDNIEKSFAEYNNHILNQEFEKSMDFMLPAFFDIIPKNQMVLMMEKIYNNPDMEFVLDKPKDIIIGDSKKIEEKFYSTINYTYDIKMKFNNTEKSEDEDQNRLAQNLIKLNLEKTFGFGNVEFNEETEFYNIHVKKDAYGISINGIDNWKFVVIEKKQKFILEKILPKEITEKI